MKVLWIVVFLFLVSVVSSFARERTLLNPRMQIDGFGAPSIQITELNGEPAVLGGGRVGWVFDRHFTIGAEGYGLLTDIEGKTAPDDRLSVGYLGGVGAVTFFPNALVHATARVLVGGGKATMRLRDPADEAKSGYAAKRSAGFFVAQPGLDLVMNLAPHVHLVVGGSYRVVAGLHLAGTSDDYLSGFAATAVLTIGEFE